MDTVRIPLSQGYEAIIDAADLPLVQGHPWHTHIGNRGRLYAARSVSTNGRTRKVLMHRLLMGHPEGQDVDHEDGDGLNNTRRNLRAVSHSFNLRNVAGAWGNSTTGVLNVQRRPNRRNPYQVKLLVDGKQRYFGHYPTLHEAAVAAYEARLAHYGPEAVARIPDPRQIGASR